MTYLRFHLVFVVPWVLGGLVGLGEAWRGAGVIFSTAITLVIVYVFTCPWDNWAVKQGIWGFPAGKYSFRIAHLPIEEYAFFGLQSLLAIGLTLGLEPRMPNLAWTVSRPPMWSCGVLSLVWLAVGRRVWTWPGRFGRRAYAFHMLFWMLPIVGLQWCLGPDLLLPRFPLIGAVVVVVGSYLTLADVLAVRWGLWFFDDRQITGPRLFGILPWEEAAFFFLTSLLVVQSFILWRWVGA